MWGYYKNQQGKMVIFAILLAFPLAIFYPHMFDYLDFISNTFINLLKLCSLPIICTSLIVTLGSMKNHHQLKSVATNSIYYILFSEIVAVIIGLTTFNLINISHGINGQALLKNITYSGSTNQHIDIQQIFNYLFTSNIFESLVRFDILPMVIFSIMLGLISSFNQHKAQPMLEFLASVREMFLLLLNSIMLLAPLAIFVLIGNSVAQSYLSGSLSQNLLGLLRFVALFFSALLIHFLWQFITVIYLYRKQLTIKQLLTEAIPIFVTAFISSSSLATLPIAMETAETLGGKKKVVEFMLPICASMNFASGMMYEVAAATFFMQILGIHADIIHQILLAIACILTGIAVGGIPETSMVSFITIFNMVGIPLSAISILMPLDRIVDRVRTMVNIFGNTCGTLIVSKSKL